jgi:hypothetical protein
MIAHIVETPSRAGLLGKVMKTATGRLTSAGTLFTSGMTAAEMSAAKGTPDTIEKSVTSSRTLDARGRMPAIPETDSMDATSQQFLSIRKN